MSYYGLTFEIGVDRMQEPVPIIRVHPDDAPVPRVASETLRAGGLVVLPTEDGYLIACNALDPGAVRRLCGVTGAALEDLVRFAAAPEHEVWLSGPIRSTHHPVPAGLMRATHLPLAAAAVPPGAGPAPTAQHVVFRIGDAADLVLDAGPVGRQPAPAGR